jgi:hypothetical protein
MRGRYILKDIKATLLRVAFASIKDNFYCGKLKAL